MRINWFPGHMNKARREMRTAMRRTDVVIEVLDARLPRSSRNPMLERLAGRVPIVRVLAKSDLADPKQTAQWLEFFESQGKPCLAIVGSRKSDAARVLGACRTEALPRRKLGRPTYAMVVGIPNVGKSTLLNSLAGRKVAAVEDRPAVTQRQQQTEASDDVLIMDTPGVLWPRLEDQEGATRLALSGAIREAVIDVESVARYGLGLLAQRYPEELKARYEIDPAQALASPAGSSTKGSGVRGAAGASQAAVADTDDESSLDLLGAFDVVGALEQQRGVDTFMLLEQLGKRRGCLLKGGEVDREKAARVFLQDLRHGRLGTVSLDWPDEVRLRLPKPPERILKGRVAAWAKAPSDGVDPRESKPRGKKLGKHFVGKSETRGARAGATKGGRKTAPAERGRTSPPKKAARKATDTIPDAKNRPAKTKVKKRLSLKKRSGGGRK